MLLKIATHMLIPIMALSCSLAAAAIATTPSFLATKEASDSSKELPAQSPKDASVLSFKEWKNERQAMLRTKFSKLQVDYIAKKNANPQDARLKALYSDLKYTKSHLDEISELSVSDYFVGYLSQAKDQKRAFLVAAEKLDSSEVAELMTAYADSLLKTSGEGISTSPRENPSAASK